MQAAHGFIRFKQGRIVRQHPRQHVVTRHHGHAQPGQSQFTRDLQHGLTGSERISRTHVGDDGDALLYAGGQHGAHAFAQQRVITLRWVAAAAQLSQRDGAFGQAFKHQRVELAALGQVLRRVDAVASVTSAGSDAEGFHEMPG